MRGSDFRGILLRGDDGIVILRLELAIIRRAKSHGAVMAGKLAKKTGFELLLWAHRPARLGWILLVSGVFVVLVVLVTLGQGNPISPPAGFGQVPQGTGACSVEKSCADLAPLMIQSAEGASPLEENLRTLTDSIGGRVTGSPAAARAVAWAADALRKAGVDSVHTEKFTLAAGWIEGRTRVDVLAPGTFPVRVVASAWSPPTPQGGITADVVDVDRGDQAGFAAAAKAVKGAILLVHSNLLVTYADLDHEYEVQPGIIARARKAGAAAIFWMSTRPSLLLYRHTASLDGRIDVLPQAIVAREDAERMSRFLAARQRVRVHFEMPNRVTGPVESENVVGEIRGREKPDEFLLLGAHLDSWELGTGALDNGCNVAMLIDAARVIHASGNVPRRSIRFALFTGEEQGELGSEAYARAHRAELDKMVADVIFDSGVGRVTGYSLDGRKDLLVPVRQALEPLKAFAPMEYTFAASGDTDDLDFLLEGVPSLVAQQEPANYMLNYHAASDTFDKVDMTMLKHNEAIAAVTAYALADAAVRIGERQTRAEIEQTLKDSGLEESLKGFGEWDGFAQGERGRQRY
jgi:carboxypeptidase Q